MLEPTCFSGRYPNNWSTLPSEPSPATTPTPSCWGRGSSSTMPQYAPLHWNHSSSGWSGKSDMDVADVVWQEQNHLRGPSDHWPTPDFPWDKYSIMDDRNIPWQVQSSGHCRPSSRGDDNFAPLGAKPIPRISDLSVTLDPNLLVLQSSSSKYQPLRESPTPPKAKKKCNGKNKKYVEETLFTSASNKNNYMNSNVASESRSVQNMNQLNSNKVLFDNRHHHSQNHYQGLSYQCASPSVQERCYDVLNDNDRAQCGSSPSDSNHPRSSSVSQDHQQSHQSNSPPSRTSPARGGGLPSKTSSIQGGGPPSSTPPTRHSIDRAAFERYYEGSVLGDHCSLSTPKSPRPPVEEQGVCGGLGPLSLALALPGKLEGLLKLLAQSLHLVLAGFCSRKARRKERESPATEQEHKLYLEEAVLERKIPETDLRQLVELPPGLGYQEWLASHTIDFFQHINLVYGTIAEFCTMSGCSDMSGPATRPYLWFDEKGKKVRVAAPQYIDYVMTFTQKTINDESIFPTKFENEFPVSFESIVKKIHRLLFHVIAHLYHSHFRELVLLSLHAHLNCIFAHFTLFNERFRLIDEKETEILHDLVLALRLHPEDREAAAAARQAAEGGDDASSTITAEDGVRHTTTAEGDAGDGRASPAVANTPGTDAPADEPQSAARQDEPLPSPSRGAASSSGPFISPDLADTRP